MNTDDSATSFVICSADCAHKTGDLHGCVFTASGQMSNALFSRKQARTGVVVGFKKKLFDAPAAEHLLAAIDVSPLPELTSIKFEGVVGTPQSETSNRRIIPLLFVFTFNGGILMKTGLLEVWRNHPGSDPRDQGIATANAGTEQGAHRAISEEEKQHVFELFVSRICPNSECCEKHLVLICDGRLLAIAESFPASLPEAVAEVTIWTLAYNIPDDQLPRLCETLLDEFERAS